MDIAWLKVQVEKGRTDVEIATELGVPVHQVAYYRRTAVKVVRPHQGRRKWDVDKDWLEAQAAAGRSDADIAAEKGMTVSGVRQYRKRHGIVSFNDHGRLVSQGIRRAHPGGRRGAAAANWKGGRSSSTGNKPGGYIRLYMPEHPLASKHGWVYEHRYVMEQKVGRLLKPGEIVDHIDRDRSNNHPDNLRLHESRSQHVKDHFSARDQLVALVGKIRAIPVHYGVDGQCFEGVVDVPALHAVLDEAMAGLQ